jgi:hypothetical protein
MSTTVPPRAAYLRVVLLELERIYNHIADVGAICTDTGFALANAHAMRLREDVVRLNERLVGHRLLRRALRKSRREFEAVKVDKLRARAKVSIIGEFWAMTTEGDGNYALQKFLESEGGECDIQLTTAWLLYNIWECARDTRERRDLRGTDPGQYGLEGLDEFGVAKRLAMMRGIVMQNLPGLSLIPQREVRVVERSQNRFKLCFHLPPPVTDQAIPNRFLLDPSEPHEFYLPRTLHPDS